MSRVVDGVALSARSLGDDSSDSAGIGDGDLESGSLGAGVARKSASDGDGVDLGV